MYMYLAWNVVHGPNEAPPNYAASNAGIRNKDRRYLAAMVESVDDSIATIVDTLKGVNMWENTVLIVTTDNGSPAENGGNYPFRGGKYTFWEGGVHGIGFLSGGFLPDSVQGLRWNGLAHAVTLNPNP